jgi:hypothetical protein
MWAYLNTPAGLNYSLSQKPEAPWLSKTRCAYLLEHLEGVIYYPEYNPDMSR